MTDAGNANAGAKRGTPRWVLVALFVSLALNLIVVGSVAGAVWRFRAPPVWATAVTPNHVVNPPTSLPDFAPHSRTSLPTTPPTTRPSPEISTLRMAPASALHASLPVRRSTASKYPP